MSQKVVILPTVWRRDAAARRVMTTKGPEKQPRPDLRLARPGRMCVNVIEAASLKEKTGKARR